MLETLGVQLVLIANTYSTTKTTESFKLIETEDLKILAEEFEEPRHILQEERVPVKHLQQALIGASA